MTDQHDLRVSDEQREAAAREIREHYAAGRLGEDELSERPARSIAKCAAGNAGSEAPTARVRHR